MNAAFASSIWLICTVRNHLSEKALKELPREKLTLMTKMWTYDEGSEKRESVSKTLDRFRQEVGTDYFDILLLHCMTKGDRAETRNLYGRIRRKLQDGIVAVIESPVITGEALVEAVDNPWCDVNSSPGLTVPKPYGWDCRSRKPEL
ncbi:MAG: aldo/keto reductase [Parabacteroides merdae]